MNPIVACTSAIVLISLMGGAAAPAHAQVAEVPSANAKGDFNTARVLGNRGYYRNTHWLIVDASGALNCRETPNGAVKSRLRTGWIVTVAFPSKDGDAIVTSQGSPWLRISIPQEPFGSRGNSGVCLVRANTKYIAPINIDFIQSIR